MNFKREGVPFRVMGRIVEKIGVAWIIFLEIEFCKEKVRSDMSSRMEVSIRPDSESEDGWNS